jgi:ATP-dependent DNA helicase RecG
MAIETVRLTGAERDKILALEEGHFLDLKSREIAPAKLSRSISAFANSNGGELYMGIAEAKSGAAKVRQWRGFDDVEAANGCLQLFEELLPLGQFHSIEFLAAPGSPGLVLHATVIKSRGITAASGGVPYIRRGAQNLPIKTEDGLQRLRLDKGVESFERQTLNVDRRTNRPVESARFKAGGAGVRHAQVRRI